MAQQGEAAPGLRGSASEQPTGFGGKEREREHEGEAAIPLSLLSVSCLLWRERETTHSSGMDGECKRKTTMRSQPPSFPIATFIFQFANKNLKSDSDCFIYCNK